MRLSQFCPYNWFGTGGSIFTIFSLWGFLFIILWVASFWLGCRILLRQLFFIDYFGSSIGLLCCRMVRSVACFVSGKAHLISCFSMILLTPKTIFPHFSVYSIISIPIS